MNTLLHSWTLAKGGLWVSDFGFRVSSFGIQIQKIVLRDSISGSGFRGFGGRVYSARESGAIVSVEEDFRQLFCRPSGSGFGVWGLEFGIGLLGF